MIKVIQIKQVKNELNDIQAICKIHNKSFSYWIESLGNEFGYKKIKNRDVKEWIERKNSFVLLAFYKEEAVGYTHCQIENIKGESEDIINFIFVETMESLGQSKIAVLPLYQRKKIASALLNEALNIAQKKKAKTAMAFVYNENKQAIGLLEKLNFKHQKFTYFKKYSKSNPYIHDSVLAEFDLKQKLPIIELNLDIQIRRIKKQDIKDMQIIFGECRPDVFGSNPSIDQIKNWFKSKWAYETLVAEYQGKVVGCMEYTKLGIIGIPGVLKEYRRKKIGQTLFYFLLFNMKKNGLKKAIADTGFILSEAIGLYQKFNFNLSRELWGWIKIL
ncbi:MAG: GNAT family N-acetyltransferase [Asgard group archaeon]|nr:GNAT family N-acetyltransferase [Asgard group archaeon]